MSLRLTFRSFSLPFVVLLILFHGIAIFCVAIVDWPRAVKICMVFAVLACLGHQLLRNAFCRLPTSISHVLLKNDGSMEISRHNGEIIAGKQLPGSFIHPWFTVIRWRADHKRLTSSIAVFPGSLEDNSFRQLRVWLKWRRFT